MPTYRFKWQERVRQVEMIHKNQLADNPKWGLRDTAAMLNRSLGKVSEDLMLAEWLKKDDRVSRIRVIQDALDYVRKKKLEEKLAGFSIAARQEKEKEASNDNR